MCVCVASCSLPRTHYDLLGVSPKASPSDLKMAWRRKVGPPPTSPYPLLSQPPCSPPCWPRLHAESLEPPSLIGMHMNNNIELKTVVYLLRGMYIRVYRYL